MQNTKHNRRNRLIALLLAIVFLLQWLPADAIKNAVQAAAGKSAVYTPGDVNGDGIINALDVTLVRRHIAGGYGVTINTIAADVNADGNVDAKDITDFRRYVAGGYGVELKPGLERFTVKFVTGGPVMEDKVVLEGTPITTLATPYWESHIFLGWCYDAELKQPVEKADMVTKNMTLYANWLEQVPLETLEQVNFASAVDVKPDFTISLVASDTKMTAQEVLGAIEAEDLTDPDVKDVVTVTGGEGVFTLAGKDGFRAGGSYRITLNSDKLTFKDQPESAREFNFSVYKEEVSNLTAQDDIRYLPADKVSSITNDGQSVATLDLALYESNGDKVTPADLTTGTFTCTEAALKVGDVVCIYEGELPTSRTKDTPKDQLGDMGYIKITAVSGSVYTYESADAEDVVFTPDVLPMPENADTDKDAGTVTVENKYLDYSADIYSYNNLDSRTTVDVGDFFAFYTGEYGDDAAKLTGYGRITAVKDNQNGTTTVAYASVTWEEVESCMDVYSREEMTAQELLKGVNTADIESEIEQQAIDSGFADEAAAYLASLALATENFTALTEHINLADYKVELTDGTPVSPEKLQLMSGGGVKAEIEETDVKAKVSKHPTHLGDIAGTNADKKGIAISLDVMVKFSITASGSDGHIEITITGSFVEEVGVDFGADVEAVWDWAAFIPYISDLRATANVDVMNYTAVSFNATMVTKENDDNDEGDDLADAIDVANEIKDMLEDLTEEEENSEEEESKLIEKYTEMVSAESDWIRIVEQNITEVKKGIPLEIPLINISFAIDFVVELDASISVGFDFEYIEGKRHIFTVSVKAGKVTTDTIDLVEKAYEFCFYAMGRIGLKVGVEMEFSIYAITKKLGSVGFSAGAGAYTKLYGYFFYELKYTESQGKSQKYSGALLIQVGIYLEAALEAQALGGMYSAEYEILDKEWLLYQAGRRDNVLDFVTEQTDMPELVMKQYVQSVYLSDDVFNMNYLDLIEGGGEEAVYNDWNDPERKDDFRNGENFVITMTNDKFSYDPKTNKISVHPDADDLKLEGEMIITWKKQPMSFSSKPMQRRVSLYWDNLRDGYMIVPYTNGGSYVPMIVKSFEQKVTKPADPVRLGYTFAGWYSDAELTKPYTFPETMPAADVNIYAKWEARTDVTYTVEHYQEDFRSNDYILAESETFTGTTDTYVTPAVKTYTGFVAPARAELKVAADGSATLRYYYNLERHTVTFDSGKIDGVDVTVEPDVHYTLKYGATISAPHMAMKGYTFLGWTQDGVTAAEVATTVGTEDLTYTAVWEKLSDTPYRIEYYVQQADGRYTLQHTVSGETATGKVFTEESLRGLAIEGAVTADEKFVVENAVVFENMTVKGMVCKEAAVDGSGKTVIKVNYGRIKHTLTFDPNYEGAEPIVKDVFYGAEVIAPQNVTRTGYEFVGWQVAPVTVMPAESLTYQAVWKPVTYAVQFDKAAGDAAGEMEDQTFTYDAAQALTLNGFTRPHYTFAGWATVKGGEAVYQNCDTLVNLTAAKDGVVTLYAVWTPVDYTVTFNANGGAHTNTVAAYNTDSETVTLADASRPGYTFAGWYDNASFSGDAVTRIVKGSGGDLELYAKWIANSGIPYKVEHYQEQLDGAYVLTETDELTGTTDASVTPAVKSYTGFTAPVAQTVTVLADGTLVVQYHYTRNAYTLTFDAAGGAVAPATVTAKYGASIALPVPERSGYGFMGWFNGDTVFADALMGAEDLTLTARWEAGKITYTVNHYQQNVDGNGYTLVKTENGTADMDSRVTPAVNTCEGFTAPASATTITISADAKDNVVNYYYTRNQYTLTWELGIGSAAGQTYTSGAVYYGAEVKAPVPAKTGYSFTWSAAPVTVMPASDLTYTAAWTANAYKVSFNGNGGTAVSGDTAARNVAFDAVYGALPVLEKTGYTFGGWFDGDTEITAGTVMNKLEDHTLTAKFRLNTYTLTYNGVEASEHSNPAEYTVEEAVTLAEPTARPGYTFGGWYTAEDFSGAPVANLSKGTTGDKTFYAKWIENTYKVTFHAYNGAAEEQTLELLYTAELGENIFQRPGYTFLGWSDGVSTYSPDTKLSRLVTEGMEALHLYAAWEKQKYTITYEGVLDDEHENAAEYTVDDAVSIGAPYERLGYNFLGWYDNSAFTGSPVTAITAGSTGHKIFYAKWEEIVFTVVLNPNDQLGTPATTLILPYSDGIPENEFVRPGYTFIGWAVTADGAKLYDDLESVSNVAHSANGANQVTLYAVWELNRYTVTYSGWDVGSNANPNAAYTTFSIETEGDIVLADPVAKAAGYQFLGWYEGESKVTTIRKTAEKDYNLVAKWAHGGTFTISYTGTSNLVSTYTVTRTVPAGVEVAADPQVVFIRTVNGTAYGTTPEVATASQQDKYHFTHISPTKEGSGMLTFTASDFSKTLTVTEKDDYNADNPISSYQIGGKARYYNVELYKVVDSTGKCPGVLGSTKTVKRTMPVSSYQVPTDLYSWYTYTIIGSDSIKITDGGYGSNDWRDIYPKSLMNQNLSAAQQAYRDLTATDYAFRVTMDIKEEDKGYQWVKFTNATGRGGSVLAEYHFEADGTSKADWGDNLSLPRADTGEYNNYEFDSGDDLVSNSWSLRDTSSSTPYALIDLNKNMSICFDASGDDDDDWRYRNLKVRLRVYDYDEPVKTNVAPLALTEYAKGETVYLTVVYNEPINSVTTTSPKLEFRYKAATTYYDSALAAYFENATYVDNGAGTNALVFKCTTKKALTADDVMKINTYLAFNESSVGGTFGKNIGTVTATVKDICSD